MSGGSFDYEYARVGELFVGYMEDKELDEMMDDLVIVLRAIEWWKSGDTCEEDYRRIANGFKKKWFGMANDRLLQIYSKELYRLSNEIKTRLDVEKDLNRGLCGKQK